MSAKNIGRLRVWWIPQIPGKPFRVPVADPTEAKKILQVLAEYDLFQLKHNIKPDFCNAGGLEVYLGSVEGWETWTNENGEEIDEVTA